MADNSPQASPQAGSSNNSPSPAGSNNSPSPAGASGFIRPFYFGNVGTPPSGVAVLDPGSGSPGEEGLIGRVRGPITHYVLPDDSPIRVIRHTGNSPPAPAVPGGSEMPQSFSSLGAVARLNVEMVEVDWAQMAVSIQGRIGKRLHRKKITICKGRRSEALRLMTDPEGDIQQQLVEALESECRERHRLAEEAVAQLGYVQAMLTTVKDNWGKCVINA